MKQVFWLSLVLIVVGALNWGLVGALNFNLVDAVFGAGSVLSKAVYVLVGAAGVAALILAPRATGAAKAA